MTPEERAEALVKSPGLLFDDNAGKMRWNISVVRQAFRDCEEDCRRSWEKRTEMLRSIVEEVSKKKWHGLYHAFGKEGPDCPLCKMLSHLPEGTVRQSSIKRTEER